MSSPGIPSIHLTERRWQGIVLALSAAVILITVWCLVHGITTIFMHLYYFPIVLLAYHYRWKGFGLATLLALAYVALVVFFDPGEWDVLLGAVYRVLVFVGIAAVIAYLSGRLAAETRATRESTEIRERYISLAPAIILVLDRQGTITYLNQKGGEILECTPEEVIGASWFDQFLPDNDREPVIKVFSELMAGEADPGRAFENRVLTCGGTEKIIRWHNTVLHDESGAITGTLAFGEDITEEKQAQDTLRKMQQFQESVITNANVWISVLAPDGTILVWNDAAEVISGYKKSDVLYKNTIWKQLYPDKHYRKKVTEEIQRIIARDTILENFETEIRCEDWTTKTIVWNTRGLRDDREIVTSYIAIGRDVTAQKIAEYRAGESARFLGAMIDTLPMPVFFKDTAGKYLGCNPPFEEYIGITRENLAGKTVYDLSPKDLADKYAAADQQLFDNPVPQRYEAQVQYADGSRHDVIFYKAPFFNKDGSLGGLIGTFLDITDRKRAEEEQEKIRIWQAGVNKILESILTPAPLDQKLKIITDGVVDIFGVDFCRIWLIDKGDRCSTGCIHAEVTEGPHICRYREKCLHLMASSGRYTHLDGKAHSRVPFGAYKIGRIASGEEVKFLTNDVEHDPRVHDHAWAKSLGLVGFAGYRLKPHEGEVLGVFALFTKFPISPDMDAILEGLSRAISLVIQQDVTGRALMESESFNRGLIENLPEYIAIYGTDGLILYVNPASAMALGYDSEALAGTHIISYIAEEYREMAMEKMTARLNGDTSSYEIELVAKDGHRRSVIVKATPIRYGNSPAILLLLLDITERKQEEEAIRLSNVILSTQQETSPDGILIVDESGKIISFNKKFTDIWGIPPEIIASRDDKPVLSFVLGMLVNPEEFLARVNYLYEHREEKSHEEIQLRDGRVLERYSTPMLGGDGRYFGRVWYFHDITERKDAEKVLRESEEKYRAFFSTSRDCVFITTLDGSWVDFNDAAIELFGYESRQDLLNTKISHIYANPGDRDAHIRYIREKGYSFEYPVDLKKKDGTLIHTLITTVARKDAAGTILGFQGSIRDVTERNAILDRMQKLLRLQEEQVRIINTSPVIAFLWKATENWPVEMVSENISQFGYTRDDFLSGRIQYSAIIHPDDLGHVTAEVEHNSSHGIDDYTQEYRISGKSGDVYWVADFTHIRRDPSGQITHYEGLVLDITDRKQMEVAIRESEQKFREIFDNANDGIEIVELNNDGFPGRFIDLNAVACQLLHYTREELLGMGPLDINTDNFSRPFDQIMRELHTIGHATFETEHRTKDGTIFPVEVNSHIVKILGKRVILSVVRDITDRKQAEDALRASERRSATLLEAIPDMMFIISRDGVYHDFRVPDSSVLAIPAEKIVGTNVRDSGFPEESTRSILRHIALALETKELQIFDYEITFPQGMRQYEARLVALNEDEVLGIVRDITERREAEDALRESRQLFSDIISFLPDPTFVIDKDGNVLAWNRALEQLSGVPAGEIIGRRDHEYSLWVYGKRRPILIDLVLNPDLDAARLNYSDIHWEGSTVTAQAEILQPGTAKRIPLSLVASPLIDSQGKITGAIESMRDISGIKEAEAALARLNASLETIVKDRTQKLQEEIVQRMQAEKDVQAALDYTRSVIEANPDLMVVLDDTGIILDVNAAGELLTGIPRENLIGTPYFGYLVEDGTVQSAFAGLLQEGMIENFVRIRRTDGHTTPLSVHATVVREWKGGKDRIIVSAHDITRQKADEEAIRSSRQMLTNVVENFPGVVFWKDRNSMYLGCNRNFSDGAGLKSPEEIIGKTDFDLPWAKTEAESYRSFDREVMEEGKPRLNIIETQLQNDGRIVWFNTNKVPLFGPDGKVIGILGASNDITRQKHDEEAIRASLEEKVVLLREIHHRVKNNLQIIISLTNLQMRQTNDPAIKQIISETQNRVRAMSLVHEKLYRSTSLSHIDFADYSRFLATQLFSYFGTDTRRVKLDFAMEEIMVDINTAVPLGLLMNELVSNALRHAFPDGKEGTIGIRGTTEGDRIVLVVRDDGIGMPPDLDWANTASLGMRLVTSLVDQVNGTITLDVGSGTAWTITVQKSPVGDKEAGE